MRFTGTLRWAYPRYRVRVHALRALPKDTLVVKSKRFIYLYCYICTVLKLNKLARKSIIVVHLLPATERNRTSPGYGVFNPL